MVIRNQKHPFLKMPGKAFGCIFLLSFLLLVLSFSLPLSTKKRWIIDAKTGERVKLACVNWASHLDTMLAEGLEKKPLSYIASQVPKHHFNCVRFTWATFMFTRYANVTVAETFDSLNLSQPKAGIDRHNHFLLNMTLVQAYEAVVDELGAHGLMVVLDHHIGKAKWLSPTTDGFSGDGNGFFGDVYFNPEEWLRGLSIVAKLFKGKSQVVAMSVSNELRGALQNEHDWYQYIREGARMIHKTNPEVLVFVSGLTWGTDLSFLKKRPFGLDLDNKLVYEAHWHFIFEEPKVWEVQPLNRICSLRIQNRIDLSGFVMDGEDPVPLFLGEVGIDQKEVNRAGYWFFTCLLAYAAERDLDWALWAMQGSYYVREGIIGAEETYGLLNANWDHLRNPTFDDKLWLIKRMIQDPNSKFSTSYLMYHPDSGSCVHASRETDVYASNCQNWSRWSHDGDGAPIRLMGSALCLKAVGDGLAPLLSTDCISEQSSWVLLSNSKLHLGARDEQGHHLCLHKESSSSSKIVTRSCICIEDDSNCMKNPQSQWFKLIKTNRN